MQEDEFEKQVKIKMDELSFAPSEPVWEAIKKQIEKKKRRISPFIFLLAIMVIAGGYFIYVNHNNIKKQNKTYATLNKNKEKNFSSHKKQKSKKQPVQFKSTYSYLNKVQSDFIKKQYRTNSGSLYVLNLRGNYSLNPNKFSITQNVNNNYSKKSENAISSQSLIKENYVTADTLVNNRQVLNADSSKQNNSNFSFNQSNIIDQNSDSSIPGIKTNSLISNSDSITQNNTTRSNKKQVLKSKQFAKWKWGITAMYGRNNLVNNFNLSAIKSSQANDYSADTISSRSIISGKPYKPASAHSYGIVLNRQIFKQAYLNLGLEYVHLSTKSYTAMSSGYSLVAVPSSFNLNSANRNYITGSEKTYTNVYNFIELPVSLQNNLLHIKQFTLSYDIGVSVMQLINEKSLIYNSKNSIFFNDASQLQRRTQFQLLSGLSLRLDTKNNGSFLFDPHVEYSLSGFLKTSDYDKLHYMQFDLQATWLLNKK